MPLRYFLRRLRKGSPPDESGDAGRPTAPKSGGLGDMGNCNSKSLLYGGVKPWPFRCSYESELPLSTPPPGVWSPSRSCWVRRAESRSAAGLIASARECDRSARSPLAPP